MRLIINIKRVTKRLRADGNKQKGMAVVMALSLVLLLVTAAMEMHLTQRSNMLTAAILRDRLTLEQMTASGIELAMAVLIKDRRDSETDSLQEIWADNEALSGFLEEIPFEQGKLELKIIDEIGKIQINALVDFPQGQNINDPQFQMWQRFTSNMLAGVEAEEERMEEDSEPLTIIYSIKDWLDSNDGDATSGLNSAESDYYESLDPPYTCKNGPFDHLSEVRLVKGVTPTIFNGLGGASGLGSYLTVYGEEKTEDQKFTFKGKININTAEAAVLAALLPVDAAQFAPNMVEYREAMSGSKYTNDLTQANWYKNVPGLADTTIDSNMISVASDIFRIIATASLNDVRVTTTAVIQREKPSEKDEWRCKVLNWKTE